MNKSKILTIAITFSMLFAFANINTITAQTAEDKFWNEVIPFQDANDYKFYLKEYPNGKYADQAREWLRKYAQRTNPVKPNAAKTPAKKTDIEYLNEWSAEVRVDLPEMVGEYKLIDAKSWCPKGCDYSGASGSFNPHLRLIFDASPSQRSIPTKDIESKLKPILLEVYCESEAIARNLNLNVVFRNRAVTPYNFWVHPSDCKTKTTNSTQGKTVFITSKAYDGNLGGVAGANSICQTHAKNAGLAGTFKAWIADDKISPWTSFTRSTAPYLMTNGNQIVANWQSLITSYLDTNFDIDEYGEKQLNAGVWTGHRDGKVEKTCNNWTSNDAGQIGTHGCTSASGNDARWGRTPCGVNRCDLTYRLYCFQQ